MLKRILIVEDNPDLRDSLALLLEQNGYTVTAVGSGEEAIDSASRAAPDVALLDIELPGIDGREVMRRLKRVPATNHVRVALVSGHVRADDGVAKPFAPDAVLKKPFTPEQLFAMLSRLEPAGGGRPSSDRRRSGPR